MKISIRQCSIPVSVGPDATEEDLASWLSYLTDAITTAYPDAEINVWTAQDERTRVEVTDDDIEFDTSDVRFAIHGLIENSFADWCSDWDSEKSA